MLIQTLKWALLASVASTAVTYPTGAGVNGVQFKPVVENIIRDFTHGSYSGKVYNDIAFVTDSFGNRLAGSDRLEKAIDYLKAEAKKFKNLRVTAEPVTVTLFTRRVEKCSVSVPGRTKDVAVTAFPYGASTPDEGITAPVVLVSSFDDIDKHGAKLRGTIVVCRPEWTGYETYSAYRSKGAQKAAEYGALAYLLRSATPYGIYTLHTGMSAANLTIPAAGITVDDADYIYRWVNRGVNVTASLKLIVDQKPKVSRNLIIDLVGQERPEEYVLVTSHLDSWDLSDAADDDASGALLAFNAITYLAEKNIQPYRTVRAILWTGEEQGYVGGISYMQQHSQEFDNVSLAMEADLGTGFPYGVSFSGKNPLAKAQIQSLMSQLEPINTSNVDFSLHGSEIAMFDEVFGVPATSLLPVGYNTLEYKYFRYHHSPGDTVTTLNSTNLDICGAMWTSLTYMVASLDHKLPR